MTKNTIREYTGYSNTSINDAIDNALSTALRPFERCEIIETFANKEYQRGMNYQVTLKTIGGE